MNWQWEAAAFIVGGLIQAAGFGFFFGKLTQKVSELTRRIELLEELLVEKKQSAYAGR